MPRKRPPTTAEVRTTGPRADKPVGLFRFRRGTLLTHRLLIASPRRQPRCRGLVRFQGRASRQRDETVTTEAGPLASPLLPHSGTEPRPAGGLALAICGSAADGWMLRHSAKPRAPHAPFAPHAFLQASDDFVSHSQNDPEPPEDLFIFLFDKEGGDWDAFPPAMPRERLNRTSPFVCANRLRRSKTAAGVWRGLVSGNAPPWQRLRQLSCPSLRPKTLGMRQFVTLES
jgi:hypothetical protein